MITITEELLQSIKDASKRLKADQPISYRTQKSSRQRNYDLEFDNPGSMNTNFKDLSIKMFTRQNILDKTNFSCGIQIIWDGKKITLSRYNGSNHKNKVADYQCHIHHATVGSINGNDRKPEHDDTQVTDRYHDLNGAFRSMLEDYNIKGFSTDLWGQVSS